MKIIKNGKVYDLSYGHYETVATLPASSWVANSVGFPEQVTVELRKDSASGAFYVSRTAGSGYYRQNVIVVPLTTEEAKKKAEDLLDYDAYVRFFGDPEGTDKGLERERDVALAAKKEAEESKDYWLERAQKLEAKIKVLEEDLAAVKGDK